MAMSKKLNPKKIPKTQADVDKAWNDGWDVGFRQAITALLWIVLNKHGAEPDDIFQLSREITDLNDSIGKGYVKWKDIEKTMKEEFDLEVVK